MVTVKNANILLQKLVEQRTEDLRVINERLSEISVTDELTQIHNRRYFNQYLDSQWKIAIREKTPLSIILVDIDYFKRYNDFYGHQKGDECLCLVVNVMKNVIKRPMDLIARYGGEEFVIILPDTREDGASYIADQIIDSIKEAAIPHEKSDISDRITISIGIGTDYPKMENCPESIFRMADMALYEAKNLGRNRSVVYRD
jgi:phosphoserine phosphatase RsbU/P